jgi:hypothetical protein
MLTFGDEVVSWHMREASSDGSKVRFYLDRLDVSDARNPQARPSINVPGAVAAYDPATQRAVTVDFQLEQTNVAEEQCWSSPRFHDYDYETGRCSLAHRELKLVQLSSNGASLLDTYDVEGPDGALRGVAGTPGRLFARITEGYDVWDEFGWAERSHQELVVFAGWESGSLQESARVEASGSGYWMGQLRAAGDHLLFNADNGLGVLDASDPASPSLQVHDLYGYGCWDLEVVGDTALCAMSEWGLQALPL